MAKGLFHGELGPTFDFLRHELDVPDIINSTYLVAVTGVTKFGHGLLCIGEYYFHVDQAGGVFPRWMNQAGYERYIRENGKRELWRSRIVDINNPTAALSMLKKLLKEKWKWLVIPHNCVGFAEAVFQAGGSRAGLTNNLPLSASAIAEAKRFGTDYTWQRPQF